MADKNVTLDSMMDGRKPRTKPSEPIDIANFGKSGTFVPPATPDQSSLQEFDPRTVMPKKEENIPTYEDQLFGDLDRAIAREKDNIDERMEDILVMADKEREEQEEADDLARIQEEDRADHITYSEEYVVDRDDYGLYDDEDEDVNYDLRTTAYPAEDSNIPVYTTNHNPVDDDLSAKRDAATATDKSISVETEDTDMVSTSLTREDTERERINILDAIDDDELDEEETNFNNNDIDSDKVVEGLKTELRGKIGIKKNFDLSKFSISKKPISASKLMRVVTQADRNIADWVMWHAKRPIALTGLSGPEILKLNPQNSGRNRLNTFRDMYRVIYDHIEDENKPEYEAWLKSTRFVDLSHIYFGLYKATFNGSNYVNYACPHCNKVFIKDIKFDDMVEFESDDVKKTVDSLLRLDTTSPKADGEYEAELVQISDQYAFALRTPSIWRAIIETASLTDRFIESHDSIDVSSYIDDIFLIDEVHQTLIPVDTKPDPDNLSATSARRIRAYGDIINRLNSEDYYALRASINALDTDTTKINYVIPECECPECKKLIPKNTDMTPDQMLFTRHQLAAIVNM